MASQKFSAFLLHMGFRKLMNMLHSIMRTLVTSGFLEFPLDMELYSVDLFNTYHAYTLLNRIMKYNREFAVIVGNIIIDSGN